MIRIGLASSSLPGISASAVIEVAGKTLVDGLEWAADCHVPCGDVAVAERVMFATLRARLSIISYATLTRVLPEGEACIRFRILVDTARALQAPALVVWGGAGPSSGLEPAVRTAFVGAARRAGDEAGRYGITVLFSMGRDTYFDGHDVAASLCSEIAHPFVKLAWEPRPNEAFDSAMEGFSGIARHTGLLYARNLGPGLESAPIAEADEAWTHYMALYRNNAGNGNGGLDRFVVLRNSFDERKLISDAGLLRNRARELERLFRASR